MNCPACNGTGWGGPVINNGRPICIYCGGSGRFFNVGTFNAIVKWARSWNPAQLKPLIDRSSITHLNGATMDAKMLKKLAAQFDELSATVIAIGGTFRAAANDGGEDSGDEDTGGKSAKSSRSAKTPAGKPGKAGKGGKKEAEEITEDSLRERLKELASTKGKDVMAEALAYVDAARLPDVDDDDYDKLNDKITELMEAEDTDDDAPDFKALSKQFKKLDAADQKKVLKACGVKAFTDIDEDDEDEVKELAEALEAVE